MTDRAAKRIMFGTSAELGDGCSRCTYPDVESLILGIRDFAENHKSIKNDVGESFTVELIAMSEEEYEQLPPL